MGNRGPVGSVGTGMNRSVLECTGVYWGVLECIGVYRGVLKSYLFGRD